MYHATKYFTLSIICFGIFLKMHILLLNDVVGEIIMDITKYPQYELYSFAELLFLRGNSIII